MRLRCEFSNEIDWATVPPVWEFPTFRGQGVSKEFGTTKQRRSNLGKQASRLSLGVIAPPARGRYTPYLPLSQSERVLHALRRGGRAVDCGSLESRSSQLMAPFCT